MKQKILITGSNGFIGQKLIDEIIENEQFELIALSKGKNRHPSTAGYRYIDGDVCDAEQMKDVVASYRPGFIIHTVAMANVETCEQEAERCRKVNVDPVKIFVKLAQDYDFQFIHLSTDFVFDGEKGPYSETDSLNPLNEYGRSKLEAESIIQASNTKWSIVRTILVYGNPHDKTKSNLVLWVKRSLEEGREIKVVTDHFRMPTLVEDLTGAIMGMIEKRSLGIYHVSGNQLYSIYEIALQVAEVWGLNADLIQPVPANAIESAVPRPSYTGFVLDKAICDLAFRPSTLIEGLTLMREQV